MIAFRTVCVFIWACLVVKAGVAAAVEPAVRPVLEPFNYQGVTLDGGPYKAQLDEVHAYYLALADDDLLRPFRLRAHRPAPGQELGGWYSSDTFHIFGQVVSGLARLYAATGDVKCRDKATRLVAGWAECIAPDGYFYAASAPNAPHYIYDKMVGGLVDTFLYCGHKEALQHLSRITDWAQSNLDRRTNSLRPTTEWYTLSENLYRAYLATGEPKYREFAQVWHYHDYWGLYADGVDLFATADPRRKDHYHAYSHVNTLGGAGLAYAVTGEQVYLRAMLNGYNYLRNNELFATGGFGPDERLLPKPQLAQTLETTHKSFETQCGAWAVFKLSKQLSACTGEARSGDWAERVALNGLCASIPMSPNGRVFYYADYHLHGAQKVNVPFPWACCAGTRPQAVADLDDIVYFKNAENLFVSQFAPSTVQWARPNGLVTVTQRTAFPESDTVTLTIAVAKPTRFGLNIRVPDWLAGPMQGRLNNTNAEFSLDTQGWASVRREWRNGDVLTLKLPMQLRLIPLEATKPFPAAVAIGPVVLAFEAPAAKQLRALATPEVLARLRPTPGQPLHFVFAEDERIHALPFYAIPAGQTYYLYIDPHVGAQISTANMQFTGPWTARPRFHAANRPGASVQAEFEGVGVRWLGYRFPDAGRAEVTIDGQKVAVVDQYGPVKEEPFTWAQTGLSPGKHALTLRILPGKNPQSADRFVNVAAFAEVGGPD